MGSMQLYLGTTTSNKNTLQFILWLVVGERPGGGGESNPKNDGGEGEKQSQKQVARNRGKTSRDSENVSNRFTFKEAQNADIKRSTSLLAL